ncbi:MAG TPA: dockerin type I domain-containing protein [Phycisphaerae bacterium]|nr:dockerin type I domain-containing protein [Phycisphaerae bacterium]
MRAFLAGILSVVSATAASAQLPTIYATRPGQVVQLSDLNGDGDYLDSGEVATFASGISGTLGAIATDGDDLFFISNTTGAPGSIYRVRDLNGDGDAFDFGEVTLYAQVSGATLVGLIASGGSLYSADSVTGQLYRFVDLNQDGDAFDFDEVTVAATGLSGLVALAAMPDGAILVAMSSNAVPVRILQDRDGDGDFLEFAENITYGENFPAGVDIACTRPDLSFLARGTDNRVLKLQDLTGDGDILDFGEVVDYAAAFGTPSKLTGTADDLFVATSDGNLWRLHDSNGDGDCLDFGEVILVAQGLAGVGGLVAIPGESCLAGDADGNGVVSLADVPAFVNGLLGLGPAIDPCRLDVNHDGTVDGRDVAGLTRRLVP